ncbi:MAG: Uncharacterised protein [Flavobacteriaceae bacterium]|nr:MAG: Uncharacterised protein [Flavobacteriaceae bacterium]
MSKPLFYLDYGAKEENTIYWVILPRSLKDKKEGFTRTLFLCALAKSPESYLCKKLL